MPANAPADPPERLLDEATRATPGDDWRSALAHAIGALVTSPGHGGVYDLEAAVRREAVPVAAYNAARDVVRIELRSCCHLLALASARVAI